MLSMLKLGTSYGFHELFLKYTLYIVNGDMNGWRGR